MNKIERELIDYLIDDTLSRSKKLRALGKKIGRAQADLRGRVDDRAWASYLTLEEAVNARAENELRVLFHRMLVLHAGGTLRR